MSVRWRNNITLIVFVAACLLLTAVSEAAPAAVRRQVKRIRSWTAPDKTRVVLDMSSQCTYRTRVLKSPHRIVIEIPSGKIAGGVRKIEVGDGVIDRIRVNQLKKGAQVVIDLPRETDYDHFALDPNSIHPQHRIVIDVKKVISTQEKARKEEHARKIADGGDHVVIIDPGHGGSKPGTSSRKGMLEKTVAMKLSRMIAAEIDSYKGFKAVLTRNGDYDVSLDRRVRIARDYGGDCFVSVHLNGISSSRIRGSEIYFLSLEGAKDENAQVVAERENMMMEMASEGETIDDMAKFILTDMGRYKDMERSRILAEKIGNHLSDGQAIPFRGIKQANFVILRGLQKPSVLVEAAYLTNRKDAGLISKESVQRQMAKGIAAGIVEYLIEHPPPDSGKDPGKMLTHVVSSGETLWGIARRYGIGVSELCDMNGIGNNSRIRPGQKLRIIR